MSKASNILNDLQNGIVVNWIKNIPRYGTSCRSRISEFRENGIYILSRVADQSSGALEYYIPKCVKV